MLNVRAGEGEFSECLVQEESCRKEIEKEIRNITARFAESWQNIMIIFQSLSVRI